MRAQTTWITVLGTLLGCAGVVLAIVGFFGERSPILGIAGLALAVGATIGTVLLYRRSTRAGRAQFEAAISTDFAADDWGWYDGSGIAIDRRRRLILVGTPEGTQRIPFDQLGAVSYRQVRSSPALSGNSIISLILLPVAVSAVLHNARVAGLHLAVGGRSLRLAGVQPKDAERWQAQLASIRGG
jgi:hypothetical protein